MMEKAKGPELFLGLLPFDLAAECLARVPRACQRESMAQVCRSWRALVHSTSFYDIRRRLGITEPSVYTCIQTDSPKGNSVTWYSLDIQPSNGSQWRRLPAMLEAHRPEAGFQTVTLAGSSRLLVLGGFEMKDDTGRLEASNKISQYCPIEDRWTVLDGEMSVPRSNFACAVIQDQIYVAGGELLEEEEESSSTNFLVAGKQMTMASVPSGDALTCFHLMSLGGEESGIETGEEASVVDNVLINESWQDFVPLRSQQLSSAEVYNFQTGKWTLLPSLMRRKSLISGVALNGAFLVSGFLSPEKNQYLEDAEIFELDTNCWHSVDLELGGRQDGLFAHHGEVYDLDMFNGTLDVYNGESRRWGVTQSERMGEEIEPGKLAVDGDDLFVISSGLSVAKTRIFERGSNGGAWVKISTPVVSSDVVPHSCHILKI